VAQRGGFKRLLAALEGEVAPAVYQAAALIEDEAKALIMAGSASGRKTEKHLHIPSRPGEPPNNDMGGLVGNIEREHPNPLRALVTSNAAYAVALEFGTSKMAARPYMLPAARNKQREVGEVIAKGVRSAIKKMVT
jgi:HK97 gp10 family phage protein